MNDSPYAALAYRMNRPILAIKWGREKVDASRAADGASWVSEEEEGSCSCSIRMQSCCNSRNRIGY